MKKGIFILSGLAALMLLSFAPPQQKKVVRLKNGNYLVQNLKIAREDVKVIQEQIEEMSKRIYKKHNDDKGSEKEGEKKSKYDDLLAIYESAKGFEAVAAFGNEEEHYILDQEIGSDLVTQTLVYRADEKKDELKGRIDDIMGKYLR